MNVPAHAFTCAFDYNWASDLLGLFASKYQTLDEPSVTLGDHLLPYCPLRVLAELL